jgi:hypothetical protein
MTELMPVVIKEDSGGKTYNFDKNTFFKIVYGPLGKDKFYFHSQTLELFADNKKREPIEVYSDKAHENYIISLHFDKAFPLIHRDNPNSVIWSAFQFKESLFGTERNVVWLKDGKPTTEIKRKLIPSISEKLQYKGDTKADQLELFASMLYIYFYYQPEPV